MAYVLFECAANLLIFICVNESANPFIGEDFCQQAFIDSTINNMDAGNTCFAGSGGVNRLGTHFGAKRFLIVRKYGIEVRNEQLLNETSLPKETLLCRDVDQL